MVDLSSVSGFGTTPSELDCVYDIAGEELASPEPVQFAEGIKAEITSDGLLQFSFPAPRDVTEVKLKTDESVELVIIPVYQDDKQGSPTPLRSSPAEQISTPLVQVNVKKVLIKKADGSSLVPTDITTLEVIACRHGKCGTLHF